MPNAVLRRDADSLTDEEAGTAGKKGTVKHAKFTAAEVVPLAATAAGSRHY